MSVANPVTLPLKAHKAQHVGFTVENKVATLTLNPFAGKQKPVFEGN